MLRLLTLCSGTWFLAELKLASYFLYWSKSVWPLDGLGMFLTVLGWISLDLLFYFLSGELCAILAFSKFVSILGLA